jgi:hypothetical protein
MSRATLTIAAAARAAAAFAATTLFAAACAPAGSPALLFDGGMAPVHFTSPTAVADSNVARFIAVGRSAGASRREITGALGDPRSMRAELTPNRHQPGSDSLIRLDYGSRVYWVRRPVGSSRELLEVVEFSEPGLRVGDGVVVDRTSFDDLRSRFGQPYGGERRGDTLMVSYRLPGAGIHETVRFDLVRERVRRVVWIFYVD